MKIFTAIMIYIVIGLMIISIGGLLFMMGYFIYLSCVGRGDEIPPAPGSPKSMYEEHWRRMDEKYAKERELNNE